MIHILVILGILACSCSQLFLKKSAVEEHKSFITSMLNWKVILAYVIFFSSLVINIWAMKNGLSFKTLPILGSSGYVFVPVLSFLFLKERVTTRCVIAIIMIIIGIAIFNLG